MHDNFEINVRHIHNHLTILRNEASDVAVKTSIKDKEMPQEVKNFIDILFAIEVLEREIAKLDAKNK